MASSTVSALATELQTLASETRRKYPDVREAADKAVTFIRANPDRAAAALVRDGPESEDILRPLFMGCSTRVAKIVIMSLSSVHRLITLKAIPVSAVPDVVATLAECISQGVDVQLRILQILLLLLTNYPSTHGDELGDALLLCFKLQESRIAVVSSTAAATLRQLVMLVFDKVVAFDRQVSNDNSPVAGTPRLTSPTQLPNGETVSLQPVVKDAFSVFEDLCLLANSERPNFLRLESLPKTFSLELIESVLTNYHELFRQRREFLLLLQHHLCPTLHKSLSDKPIFPLTLRSIRVVFILLKQFIRELETEAEVFMSLITQVITSDHEHGDSPRPPWMRVLAMEIMRGLCHEVTIVRALWDQYDSKSPDSTVFSSLLTALKRLAMEKPALLGVESQMFGVGVTSSATKDALSSYGYGIVADVGAVSASLVSGAANMVGMAGGATGGGLSVLTSAMKLQCIDQLDKADPPPIPETYLYLLALQCITSLSNALAQLTIPLFNSISQQRPRGAGDPAVRAPPALDLSSPSSLPSSIPEAELAQLRSAHGMLENAWPATLAALSFFISTGLSEDLFSDVLSTLQGLTNACGALGLSTPRDAFMACLARFAIPPGVVSSLDSLVSSTSKSRNAGEPSTPLRTAVGGVLSAGAESLGLTASTSSVPPGLSERNVACLKVFLGCALFLAGSLGESWFVVLETMQGADYVIAGSARAQQMQLQASSGNKRSSALPPAKSTSGAAAAGGPRPVMMQDLDVSTDVQALMNRVFDASKNMDDEAFRVFVGTLCRLSSEMIGMQFPGGKSDTESIASTDDLSLSQGTAPALLSPSISSSMGGDGVHRRRASGMQLAKSPFRSGDYAIAKLGTVSHLNLHRLIYRDPTLAWESVTGHLLSVIRNAFGPGSIRLQAAEVLDSVLLVVSRNINTPGEMQAAVQLRVLEALAQQVISEVNSAAGAVATDIRKLGLETLHDILEISAHSFVVGWNIVFEMMSSVCQPPKSKLAVLSPSLPNESSTSINSTPSSSKPRPPPLKPLFPSDKSNIVLIRVAFKSLKLVCEAVDILPPSDLRLCIATIALFGQQSDTNIALTAAESLLWGVSDSIQAKRKRGDAEEEATYSELWMYLLKELRTLCADERLDVRNGAIHSLFRSLQLYGATLTPEMWHESLDGIILPLLDATSESLSAPAPVAEVPSNQAPPPPGPSWDSSKSLIFQLIGSLFSAFLVAKIIPLKSFTSFWDRWADHVVLAASRDPRNVSTAGLTSWGATLVATRDARETHPDAVNTTWERSWVALDAIGTALDEQPAVTGESSTVAPFTQEALLALTQVIQTLYGLYGETWDLERLRRLLHILKAIMTYSKSPDYRPDVDALSPVQTAAYDCVHGLDLTHVSGLPSLVMIDLADYANLAYYAGFTVESTSPARNVPPKHVTYIALSKKAMPQVVKLAETFKDDVAIYADGTIEHVITALSIPIKLRYDCPPASKFGSDAPLWKTATNSFLAILSNAVPSLTTFGEALSTERVEGFWKRTVECIRGGLLADCTPMDRMPFPEQEAEERFDRALLDAIDTTVIPHIGDLRVSDSVTTTLCRALEMASILYEVDDTVPLPVPTTIEQPGTKPSAQRKKAESLSTIEGTTAPIRAMPREQFEYACFDLLLSICSRGISEGEPSGMKRVASLALPSLLNRCHGVFSSYIVDEALRGSVPFPRLREEELLYCLRRLPELLIWPGCLWAALSDDPTASSQSLPPIDPSLPPHELIADATKRSPHAHLFHFYPSLYEIATIPRTPPSAWIIPSAASFSRPLTPPDSLNGPSSTLASPSAAAAAPAAIEVDARQLAKACLRRIGKEIGAEI